MIEEIGKGQNEYYVNRELSQLSFLNRVLDEAGDSRNSAGERGTFLGITSRSLDEFFAVRLSTLIHQSKEYPDLKDICGLTAAEQIALVLAESGRLMDRADRFAEGYVNLLVQSGIVRLTEPEDIRKCFNRKSSLDVMSTIKTIAARLIPFDSGKVKTEKVNIIFKSKSGDDECYLLPLESDADRVLFTKGDGDGIKYALMEDILQAYRELLPDNIASEKYCVFKAVRDRDELFEQAPEPEGIRSWLEGLNAAPFVCAVAGSDSCEECVGFLRKKLSLPEASILKSRFVDMVFCSYLAKVRGEESSVPMTPGDRKRFFGKESLFRRLSESDILCCHPYESFDSVVSFLKEAAEDPKVRTIRQTVYRTGKDSEIINLLCEAAEKGKDVRVLMELRARYDEERNLSNTEKLIKAGAKVFFGRSGIKTHGKLLLVERDEAGGIRRYAHISTGNYNEYTAKTYTDVGLFTSAPGICDDVAVLLDYAEGLLDKPELYSLCASPFGLREEFLRLIEREKGFAAKGVEAEITAKLNSLCDKDIIDALYDAAENGVRIRLAVRGICSLKVGLPSCKSNISVCSVIGKQLEHSRIFRFKNGGNTEYYCSSADWMPRNFESRIEVLFPVRSEDGQKKLDLILDKMTGASSDSRMLNQDGTYDKTGGTESVQEELTRIIGGPLK